MADLSMGIPLDLSSITLDPYDQAWQRLLSGTVPQDELASLMDTIFSNNKGIKIAECLQGNVVQIFIDVTDAV